MLQLEQLRKIQRSNVDTFTLDNQHEIKEAKNITFHYFISIPPADGNPNRGVDLRFGRFKIS